MKNILFITIDKYINMDLNKEITDSINVHLINKTFTGDIKEMEIMSSQQSHIVILTKEQQMTVYLSYDLLKTHELMINDCVEVSQIIGKLNDQLKLIFYAYSIRKIKSINENTEMYKKYTNLKNKLIKESDEVERKEFPSMIINIGIIYQENDCSVNDFIESMKSTLSHGKIYTLKMSRYGQEYCNHFNLKITNYFQKCPSLL